MLPSVQPSNPGNEELTMRYGNPTDYESPFIDVNRETPSEAIDRVVAIGLEPLCDWWERVKGDTSPATYGLTRSEFTGNVAYLVTGGSVTRCLADESAPRFEAARRLGVAINWT
jgi:hypothetical protein